MNQKHVYTVSELTRAVRGMIETALPGVWVEGEISNFILHSSGHMYFGVDVFSFPFSSLMSGYHSIHLPALQPYMTAGRCTRCVVSSILIRSTSHFSAAMCVKTASLPLSVTKRRLS